MASYTLDVRGGHSQGRPRRRARRRHTRIKMALHFGCTVAATLKADRGVVLAARTEYGHALYCAAATLQADRNSMLTAVTQRDQRCPAGTEDGAHRSTDHFSSSSSVVPVRSPWVRHRLEIAANVHSTQLSGSSGS